MPPKDPKERMDWCGHVTLTHAQNEFFKEFQNKGLITEARRAAGLLEHRPTRNPMRAEKTPRKLEPGQRFDFSIPAVNTAEQTVAEKFAQQGKPNKQWEYPDNDWGLMSKFKTQKASYEKFKALHSSYQGTINNVNTSRNRNDSTHTNTNTNSNTNISNTTTSSSNSNNNNSNNNSNIDVPLSGRNSARLSTSRSDLAGFDPERYGGQSGRITGRTALNTIRESGAALDESSLQLSQSPSLGHFSMNTLKVVGATNPEILDKVRAERAAQFVSSLKCDPAEPPKLTTDYNATQSARDRMRPIFRPGGGTVELDHLRKKDKGSEKKGEADPMAALMSQLKETNQAIEAQKAKLGLKK